MRPAPAWLLVYTFINAAVKHVCSQFCGAAEHTDMPHSPPCSFHAHQPPRRAPRRRCTAPVGPGTTKHRYPARSVPPGAAQRLTRPCQHSPDLVASAHLLLRLCCRCLFLSDPRRVHTPDSHRYDPSTKSPPRPPPPLPAPSSAPSSTSHDSCSPAGHPSIVPRDHHLPLA